MKDYTMEDFLAYYGGAWFLHPTENVPCYVHSPSAGRGMCHTRGTSNQLLPVVNYKELTFEMFKNYPRLGYRHIEGGRFLYTVSRRAMRQRGKGIRNNTVQILRVPEVSRLCDLTGYSDSFASGMYLSPAVLNAIFFPNYPSLKEAVASLTEDDNCLGLALSSRLAITLLSNNVAKPFVILFRGQRAAYSVDGKVWTPSHPEYVQMLKRNLPSIQLEGN